MKLHLNYTPKPAEFKISQHHNILLVGSCFTENLGKHLQSMQFNTFTNPNGIVFNPISISQNLSNSIQNKPINELLLLQHNQLHVSYLNHSSLFAKSKNELIDVLTNLQQKTNAFLKTADILIITFGSAYAYEHIKTNHIVANCHKQPSALFEKKLLSIAHIVKEYKQLLNELSAFNPNIKIIFTVSPVKHLKDGVEENNLSKATLLLAVNELTQLPNCFYFPAYELINDDLRDYRFYKEDMAHPNEQAIKYVLEKFSETYFNKETQDLIKELNAINIAETHKLLFPESEDAKLFQLNLQKKKEVLKNKYPHLNF